MWQHKQHIIGKKMVREDTNHESILKLFQNPISRIALEPISNDSYPPVLPSRTRIFFLFEFFFSYSSTSFGFATSFFTSGCASVLLAVTSIGARSSSPIPVFFAGLSKYQCSVFSIEPFMGL